MIMEVLSNVVSQNQDYVLWLMRELVQIMGVASFAKLGSLKPSLEGPNQLRLKLVDWGGG